MYHASELPDLPDYLTTTELAALLRVSRGTVSGWARRGLIPYVVTPTGYRRFSRATVQRLLEEHRTKSEDGDL
ncbi:helix-turn-helix domain-containing protein [Actinomadura scrupuli]|uniref:helix-turn-helix domain-containing protein n=1 Tax=Actinomadura scrupuli TaxID=559629 RepID=UPI003D9724A9